MANYKLSPNQYIFVEKVLKAQVVPVLESKNFVSLVDSVNKARQADDGLVYIELSPGDIQLFFGFLAETSIKVKDIDFVLSVVSVFNSNSGFSSTPESQDNENTCPDPDFLNKGENNGL